MDKIICSCNDHIEEILDIFLDEIEKMPVMEAISDADLRCRECQEMAVYKLSGSEVEAKWE